MATKRTEIINLIVENLKNINGEVSPYKNTYTFLTNLFNNVYRKLAFLDEINDFPALYLSAGTEYRIFQTKSLTEATLEVIIRGQTFSEDNSQELSNKLLQAIEHVIYNLPDYSEIGILDITIENITVDEGLASPYGIAQIDLSIRYRL